MVKACECVCRTRGWWSRHVSVFVGRVGGGQGM